jgi:hypothetical protein
MIDKLRQALAEGGNTHTVEDVLAEIERGDAQLWIDDGALIITKVEQYPQARVLSFWLAAGELEPVKALRKRAMEWGKSRGCDRAVLVGRRGWLRALKDTEWRETLAVMEATL